MDNIKKLFNNTIIFTISNFASKFLIFLLLPFYTRVLTAAEFGTGDLVISTVSFLMPIFTLCISEAALRFSMNKKENKNTIFTYGLNIVLVGFLVLLLFYPVFTKISVISDYLFYLYIIYLSSSLNQYFNQFSRGIGEIKLIGIVGITGTLVTVVSNILLLAVFQYGIEGYLISYMLTNIVSAAFLFFFGKLYKFMKFKRDNTKDSVINDMKSYSIPLISNKVSWWVIQMFNRYALSYFKGATLVGIFTAANRIPSFITTIYGVLQQAILLSVIDEYEESNNFFLFTKTYEVLNLVLLMVALIINTSIEPMAFIMFGESFYEAYKIAPLLVLSSYFGSLHGNMTTIFSATKKTTQLFHNSFIGMIITIVLNILLVPKYGLYGAAITSFLTYFFMWIRLFFISKKQFKLNFKIKTDLIAVSLLIIQWLILLFYNGTIYWISSFIIIILIVTIKFKDIKQLSSIGTKLIKYIRH